MLPSSKWHAFFNELMCLVGIGSLSLPYVTAKVGVVLSLFGLALLSYCSWEGIRFVAVCAAEERKKQQADTPLTGGATSKSAWYVVANAGFGRAGWNIVAGTLAIAQLGVATSYVDQVRGTLEYLLDIPNSVSLPLLWIILSLICLQLNPGMRTVAWMSGAAFAAMVYIYVLTGYYAAQAPSDGLNRASNTVKLCDPSNIGMWYGPALFAFEGMGSALSIYDSMGVVDPKPFIHVISYGYAFAVISYAYIILVGYIGFGDDVTRTVTHSFPDTPLGRSADYVLSASLMFAFVLQMTPIFQIVEDCLPQARVGWTQWAWVPSRVLLVGATALVSYAIPDLERVTALTGSLAFSFLCFVLPAILFLRLQPTPDATYSKVLACCFIPLGIGLAFWGSIATITDATITDIDAPDSTAVDALGRLRWEHDGIDVTWAAGYGTRWERRNRTHHGPPDLTKLVGENARVNGTAALHASLTLRMPYSELVSEHDPGDVTMADEQGHAAGARRRPPRPPSPLPPSAPPRGETIAIAVPKLPNYP